MKVVIDDKNFSVINFPPSLVFAGVQPHHQKPFHFFHFVFFTPLFEFLEESAGAASFDLDEV